MHHPQTRWCQIGKQTVKFAVPSTTFTALLRRVTLSVYASTAPLACIGTSAHSDWQKSYFLRDRFFPGIEIQLQINFFSVLGKKLIHVSEQTSPWCCYCIFSRVNNEMPKSFSTRLLNPFPTFIFCKMSYQSQAYVLSHQQQQLHQRHTVEIFLEWLLDVQGPPKNYPGMF